MATRPIALTGLLLLTSAMAAGAQPAAVEVEKLPLSVQRIHRELRQSTVREERHGLSLRYIVDVYGKAPPIALFTQQDNLLTGPVPYGGPTHREIIEVITPREYRAQVMDFSALARWIEEKAKQEK